jgi:hypothetical protein
VQEFWQVLRQPGGALQKTGLASSLAGATPRRGFHEVVRSWKNWGNPERSREILEESGKSWKILLVALRVKFLLRESILMLQSRTYCADRGSCFRRAGAGSIYRSMDVRFRNAITHKRLNSGANTVQHVLFGRLFGRKRTKFVPLRFAPSLSERVKPFGGTQVSERFYRPITTSQYLKSGQPTDIVIKPPPSARVF